MFVHYGCECGFGCKVSKVDEKLNLLSIRMRCPGCGQESLEVLGDMAAAAKGATKAIMAQHLFDACMGRGLPDQRLCSPESLREALIHGSITGLDLEESTADPNRSMISSFTVSQGHTEYRVHLGSGAKGVSIYKLEEV